jgi:hypothetical protein
MGFPADGVDNHGWKLYITSLVMIISSGLFVVARCIARHSIHKLGSDDVAIIVSLVSCSTLPMVAKLNVQDIVSSSIDVHTACDTPWLRNAQRRSRKARSSNGVENVLHRSDTIQSNRLPQQSRCNSIVSTTFCYKVVSCLVVRCAGSCSWIQHRWYRCDNLAMRPYQGRMGQVSRCKVYRLE